MVGGYCSYRPQLPTHQHQQQDIHVHLEPGINLSMDEVLDGGLG